MDFSTMTPEQLIALSALPWSGSLGAPAAVNEEDGTYNPRGA